MSEAVETGANGPGAGIARVLPDDRLARRAAAGDERAFAAIFDRYHQRLYRYCAAIVGNPQDAQDALQNTMVKVLRALPGEERRLQLKPWLYRIAHNESVELLRRRRETRELDPELVAPGQGLVAEVASRERLRLLIADLDELPERQRGVLVMRELAGLEFAEIGAALGTSAAVARQTLYEARLGLRQMDEGREMSCEAVTRALSDRDGRVTRRRDLRAHLRHCAECRHFREEIEGREHDFAALAPLPALATAGILQGLLGGGAAKSIGAATVAKGVATVAVVAAIGAGAADRSGLVDVGLPGGAGSSAPAPAAAGGSGAAIGDAALDAAGPGAAGGSAVGARALRDRRVAARVALSRRADAAPASGPGAATPGPAPASSPGSPADAGSPGRTTVPSSQGAASAAHPHGRGHEKQHPSASAHGQQTAATHKATGRGSGGTGLPAHPSHPAQPAHPSAPRGEKGSAAPTPAPSATTPESQPRDPAPSPEPAPASPAHETGKKP